MRPSSQRVASTVAVAGAPWVLMMLGTASCGFGTVAVVLSSTAGSAAEAPPPVLVRSPSYLPQARLVPEPLDFIAATIVADVDGDGRLDIVTANDRVGAPDNLSIFRQLADGSFAAAEVPAASSAIEAPRALLAEDLDDDGALDLVTADAGADLASGVLSVFVLRAGGYERIEIDGGAMTCSPLRVFTDDVDRDGAPDLLLATALGVTVLRGVGDGTFFPGAQFALPSSAGTGTAAASGDLDGDGDVDLVVTTDNDALVPFFQVAPGVFNVGVPSPVDGAADDVLIADLDGDGAADALTASTEQCTVTIVLSVAQPVTPAPIVFEGTAGASGVTAFDFDLDGDADFLVTLGLQDTIEVFLQFEARDWRPAQSLGGIGETPSPSKVLHVDLDGDGDEDLVIQNNDDVVVFVAT